MVRGRFVLLDRAEPWGGNQMSETTSNISALPADDLSRALALAQVDRPTAQHIGLVGDTYTILVAGKDTGDRFCVIDMHVPPGGGPPPHRHDFEETFVLLEGEMAVTFRGEKFVVRAGDTINVPANAPHQFHNSSAGPVRMICICAPRGMTDSSLKSEFRWRRGLRRHPSWMGNRWPSLCRRQWQSPRSITPNFWSERSQRVQHPGGEMPPYTAPLFRRCATRVALCDSLRAANAPLATSGPNHSSSCLSVIDSEHLFIA